MDSLNFRVQVFDKDASYLSEFSGNGASINDLMKTKGSAVDSEGDRIFRSCRFSG